MILSSKMNTKIKRYNPKIVELKVHREANCDERTVPNGAVALWRMKGLFRLLKDFYFLIYFCANTDSSVAQITNTKTTVCLTNSSYQAGKTLSCKRTHLVRKSSPPATSHSLQA